jgi:hypothetical protein
MNGTAGILARTLIGVKSRGAGPSTAAGVIFTYQAEDFHRHTNTPTCVRT